MHHEGNHIVRILMAGLLVTALLTISHTATAGPGGPGAGSCSTQLPSGVTVTGKILQTEFATNYFFCITNGKTTPPASVYTSELSFHFSTQNGKHCYILGAGSADAVIAYMIKDSSGVCYKGSVDMASAVVATAGDAVQPEPTPTPTIAEEDPVATDTTLPADTLCADGSQPDAFGICAATVDFDTAVSDDTDGDEPLPCTGAQALIDPSCLVEVADSDEDGIPDDEDACPEDFDITNACTAGANNLTTSTSTDPKKTTGATNPFDGGGGCALAAGHPATEHSHGIYIVLSCIALLCAYGFTRSTVRPQGDDEGDRS